MDPAFSCPCCLLPFQPPPSETVPTLLTCGHTICSACADACAVVKPSNCPTCNVEFTETTINHVLADAAVVCLDDDFNPNCFKHLATHTEDVLGFQPQDISQLLDKLHDGSIKLHAAANQLVQDKDKLLACVHTSIERFQITVADAIARVNDFASSTIASARAVCADRVKILEAQVDELVVSAGQVSACMKAIKKTMYSQNALDIQRAVRCASSTQKLCTISTLSRVPTKLAIACSTTLLLHRLDEMASLCLYDVDSRKSSAFGNGLVYASSNGSSEFRLSCVSSDGTVVDWIAEQDVSIRITDLEGKPVLGTLTDIRVVEKGVIRVQYTLNAEASTDVYVHVSVCDVVLYGSPWRVGVVDQIRPDAKYAKTIPLIESDDCYGFTVTLDGQYLVVANYFSHTVSVYRSSAGECVATFGCFGTEAGQFYNPVRVCSTPRGTILVSECGNNRIQEVTLDGNHVRFIGIGVLDDEGPYGICMQEDVVATARKTRNPDDCVVLFCYRTGALIRKFGSLHNREGQIQSVTGVSFLPDGGHILVSGISGLFLFTVQGEFVNCVGSSVAGGIFRDVLCSGSAIFVADDGNNRICVFSSETFTLDYQLRSQSNECGPLIRPTALAAYKNKLYVLDRDVLLVEMFE